MSCLPNTFEKACGGAWHGQVGRYWFNDDPVLLMELGRQATQTIAGSSYEDQICTSLGELLGVSQTDAGSCASYQYGLPIKSHGAGLRSSKRVLWRELSVNTHGGVGATKVPSDWAPVSVPSPTAVRERDIPHQV
jgi:hypothetical protein